MRSTLARHPRHLALLSFICGLLLSGYGPWAALAAAVALPTVRACTGRPVPALLAAALVLGGASIGAARTQAIDGTSLGRYLDHAVIARGYVVKRERATRVARRLRVRLTEIVGGVTESAGRGSLPGGDLQELAAAGGWRAIDDLVQVRIAREAEYPPLAVGDEARIEGVLERPVTQPESDFDYAEYLRRAGVHAVLDADVITPTGRTRGGVTGVVDGLRRRAEAGVGAGLEFKVASLARGIVLGQDEGIPARLAGDFKDSGLAHLLAVSGQNVTLLAVLALPVLAALGLGRKARLAGVLALIAVYVPLTGAGPSVLRAGAMGAAATAAALAGRPGSRWYFLMLAAAFTLVLDPRAYLDVGWQLSFAAVVGIFCLAAPLRTALRALPRGLAEGAALTVAATVATAPLMAFHFERVSVVGLLANLLALPVVAPIMWFGIFAAALSQLSLAGAALVNALNGFCLAYLAAVAHWTAQLPNAVVPVEVGSWWKVTIAYAGIAGALLAGRSFAAPNPSRRARRRAFAAVAALLFLVLVAPGAPTAPPEPPHRFTVSFLDVGQGDATLLQAPGGVVILVDGGPPHDGIVSRLKAAGVRSLDLMVLTHAQEDHQGGLEDVLRQVPVASLLDGGVGSRDPAYQRISRLAREKGVRILVPRTGQRVQVGSVRLQVLNPARHFGAAASTHGNPNPKAAAGEDPNERAVVLLASYGSFDVFLAADAESDVTLELPLRPVELLKVAHHGSEDERLPSLLDRLEPQAAVIEVGRDNRFGHPAAQTLRALRTSVPRVYRTDLHGDVRVTVGSDGPRISTERGTSDSTQ